MKEKLRLLQKILLPHILLRLLSLMLPNTQPGEYSNLSEPDPTGISASMSLLPAHVLNPIPVYAGSNAYIKQNMPTINCLNSVPAFIQAADIPLTRQKRELQTLFSNMCILCNFFLA